MVAVGLAIAVNVGRKGDTALVRKAVTLVTHLVNQPVPGVYNHDDGQRTLGVLRDVVLADTRGIARRVLEDMTFTTHDGVLRFVRMHCW